MARSFLNAVNNLAEGILRIKCKYEHDSEICRTKYKNCECFLEYTNVKDNLIEHEYLCCNKNYQKTFDENLKTRLFNTYKFSNHDLNKCIILLQKCVYPYYYINYLEKFNETSLPEKGDFYSDLNMEDITDTDYTHVFLRILK